MEDKCCPPPLFFKILNEVCITGQCIFKYRKMVVRVVVKQPMEAQVEQL
jgi:hypothetical protein